MSNADEVRAAAAEWDAAIVRRDVEVAAQFLAPEYSLMAPGIGEMPRAKWLENLPGYVIHENAFTDVQLHTYGDTAVLRARYMQRATVAGQDRSGSMLVTDVWVKHDHWQIVARHTSWLEAGQ